MPRLSFTTSACPNWDLVTIIRRAREFGYDAIDFQGMFDDFKSKEFLEFFSGLDYIYSLFKKHALSVSGISCSASFLLKAVAEPQVHLDHVKKCLEIADKFHAPVVRIFDGRIIPNTDFCRQILHAAQLYRPLLDQAGELGIVIAIETLEGLVRSEKMHEALEAVNHPNLKVIWDLSNPFRKINEMPETTVGFLGKALAGVHIKDSVVTLKGDVKPVLIGQGTNPVEECLQELKNINYQGYLTFEWEKKWFPQIEEPEIALPHFVRQMKKWMKKLEF